MGETNVIGTDRLIEMITRIEKIDGKIDRFIDGQDRHEADIKVLKTDVQGLKDTVRSTRSYFHGVMAAGGVVVTFLSTYVIPVMLKKLGM